MNRYTQFRRVIQACFISSVAVMGLASCSSFTKEKSGAEIRKEGYAALLKTVKPGMYRRQLYAVLPPCEKPMAKPPSVCGVAGVLMYFAHAETHKLDTECHLRVAYQLKNGDEYKTSKTAPPRRSKARASKQAGSITPDSIDALLFAEVSIETPFVTGRTPSRENPDDIIMSISDVHLESASEAISLEITISPTQEHGRKFGTGPSPSANDFPFSFPR
jgi:hypothetical protein